MSEITFPDFHGRIVALELDWEEETPLTVLEETRFEFQGGRLFIVGRVPESVNEDDWCAGATCAVAWDEIVSYYLFDSIEDYLEKVGED